MPNNSFIYLPDGYGAYFPQDPHFWQDEERVSAKEWTQAIGQVGAWYCNRPIFQGLQTVSVSVPSATWSAMVLQTEMIDPYDTHSTTTNPSQVIVPLTGMNFNYHTQDIYLCTGYVSFNPASTTPVFIAGANNSEFGVVFEGMKIRAAATHAVTTMIIDLWVVTGDSTHYLELEAFHTSASAQSTVVSSKCPSFTTRWVGGERSFNTLPAPLTAPHTMIPQDQVTGPSTGSSPVSPGVKVPLDNEIFNPVAFYNSPPICRITSQGGSQSITNTGVFQSIQFPNKDIDVWGQWSSGANTRFTCVRAGFYYIAGMAAVSESSGTHSGFRLARMLMNGTTVIGGNTTITNSGTDTTGCALYTVTMLQLAVGDYLEVQMAQTQSNAPTSLTVTTGQTDSAKLIAVWMTS